MTEAQPDSGSNSTPSAMQTAVPFVVPSPALQLNLQSSDAALSSAKTTLSAVEPIPAAPAKKKQKLEVQEIVDLLESGVCPKDVLIVLEICSGSGKFSLHMASYGLHVVPVDHDRNSHRCRVPTVKLDMAVPSSVEILSDLVNLGFVVVVLAAVPCGTASRAREIRVSASSHGPRPLRSERYPLGLPKLGTVDALRVRKANSIYFNTLKVIKLAASKGAITIIENPRRSWLWEITEFKDLLLDGYVDVDFQHCRWSTDDTPARPKWTRLRTNCKRLLLLAGDCKQKHVHLGWKVLADKTFATAGEAEYPHDMCAALSQTLILELHSRGHGPFALQDNADLTSSVPHRRRRPVLGKQPRGRQLPAVISEFKEVVQRTAEKAKSLGLKILRPVVSGGVTGASEVMVGIFRTPDEFVTVAKLAEHPANLPGAIPDILARNLVSVLNAEPADFIRSQLVSVREMIKLSKDLETENAKALDGMEPKLREVMSGKKMATMRALTEKHGYADSRICDDMTEGFQMVGQQPYSGVFDRQVSMPVVTEEMLRKNSTIQSQALLKRVNSSGDAHVDQAFYSQVLEEVANKWLIGPLDDLPQLAKEISSVPHLSRRFPLVQASKIRAIDDMKESGVNTAFGCQDKLWLMDADTTGAMVRLAEDVLSGKVTEVYLPNGTKVNAKPLICLVTSRRP